jgi:hypothetical protein
VPGPQDFPGGSGSSPTPRARGEPQQTGKQIGDGPEYLRQRIPRDTECQAARMTAKIILASRQPPGTLIPELPPLSSASH